MKRGVIRRRRRGSRSCAAQKTRATSVPGLAPCSPPPPRPSARASPSRVSCPTLVSHLSPQKKARRPAAGSTPPLTVQPSTWLLSSECICYYIKLHHNFRNRLTENLKPTYYYSIIFIIKIEKKKKSSKTIFLYIIVMYSQHAQ